MKAWIKHPGTDPVLADIEKSEEALEEIVGGDLLTVLMSQKLAVVCNNDTQMHGEDYNCMFRGYRFYGTIVIVGWVKINIGWVNINEYDESLADTQLSYEELSEEMKWNLLSQ